MKKDLLWIAIGTYFLGVTGLLTWFFFYIYPHIGAFTLISSTS